MKANRTPHLSVLAPAHNEEGNIRTLVEQIASALSALEVSYEIIVVDDGSSDSTRQRMLEAANAHPELRPLRLCVETPGRGHGQSAALCAAIRASRGRCIAMLDADLQNDPADLPAMLALLSTGDYDLVQGDRSGNRRDTALKRLSSLVGRASRRVLLGDSIRDTGCSLRVMRREVAEALPLEFRGVHRFIPLLARQLGYRVCEVPVRHRHRQHGRSKYGTLDRAIPAFFDCLAIRWMHSRRRGVEAIPLDATTSAPRQVPSRPPAAVDA